MKLDTETTMTALLSAFVAPTISGVVAGVCPQTGFRHLADALGHRPWSAPIT
jgi:hypothetical protein